MNHQSVKMGTNKSFGIVFFIVFLLIAIWPLLSSNEIRIWSLVISFIFLILGIFNSKKLTPLNKLWMRFGLFLGSIYYIVSIYKYIQFNRRFKCMSIVKWIKETF